MKNLLREIEYSKSGSIEYPKLVEAVKKRF